MYNILSSDEINDLLNNPVVQKEKENLSDTQKEVKFSISFPDLIKTKIENSLSIDLSQTMTIPMRWIKGDTLPHIDKGEKHFNNTYLIYLTDSIGNLIIDGQTHSITAGECHIFNEGLEHYTINTGNTERLMIGPMSESGFRVGLPPSILYFNNITDASNEINPIGEYYGNYTIQTVNDISSWMIFKNVDGDGPTQNAGPHYTDEDLIPTGVYYVYPYIAPTPVSDICFPAGTLIVTDQGEVPIEQINAKYHTIENKEIVAIIKTPNNEKRLVEFQAEVFGPNSPTKLTRMSKEHKIYYKGRMIEAKHFVGHFSNKVKYVNYSDEFLYNVLLRRHDKMIVNNLTVETLHPLNSNIRRSSNMRMHLH